jgi:DNA-binding NarL/FixJ family response regulator
MGENNIPDPLGNTRSTKIHVFVISKNPFTIEGLRTFVKKHSLLSADIIFSACSEKCDEMLNKAPCRECLLIDKISETITRETTLDIILVDNYDFFNASTERDLTDIEDKTRSEGAYNYKIRNLINVSWSKIIILTGSNNPTQLKLFMNKGVRGLVHSTSPKENILTAIEAIMKGTIYIDAQIDNFIYKYQSYINSHPVNNLTQRQLAILYNIANGLKSHQIAEKFYISVSTEERHRVNIKEKLNIKTAEELYDYANENKDEIKYLLDFPNKNYLKKP